MSEPALEWITGSGGPLLLLPEELLEAWSGIDPPLGGRVIDVRRRWDPDHAATDYDRACEIDTLIANVEVGHGRGIVLAGEPYPTGVVRRDGGAWLVRWIQAPSAAAIVEFLARHPPDTLQGVPATIDAHPGPLILFDAACPGPEVEEDRIVLDLHPGRYRASAIQVAADAELALIVIGLDRVR
jgi:hypothetical protein